MTERYLTLGNVGAAAAVFGGALLIVLPRFGMSVLQLVIVTVAVAAALRAFLSNIPPSGWLSPFKWMSPFVAATPRARTRRTSDEVTAMRSKLSGWRQPIEGGPALPPDVVRLLQPLIRTAVELDPADGAQSLTAGKGLSSATRAVLSTAPLRQPRWRQMLLPNERQVCEVVHCVLDDLERLGFGFGAARRSSPTDTSGTT